jgi:hypothetical protein
MNLTDHAQDQLVKWLVDIVATPPGDLWVKLHVGDPGSDATGNPAVETSRVLSAWSAPDVDGISVTTIDLDWIAVAATEIYTHISLWDDATAGNAWLQGPLSALVPITLGSDFQIPAGTASLQGQ